MSILPSACFLLIAPLQTARNLKGAIAVRPSRLRSAKLVRSLPLPSSSPGRNIAHATIGGHPYLCGPPTRSFSPLVILFLVASHHIHRRRVLCLGPVRRSSFGGPLADTTPTEPPPFLFHNHLPSHLCIPGRRPRTDRMAHSEPNAGSRP